MNGGATNPEVHVFACGAAQAKKVIEVNKRLGGGNLVFWGGREGYQTLLNTDVKREIDHLAGCFCVGDCYDDDDDDDDDDDGVVGGGGSGDEGGCRGAAASSWYLRDVVSS
eukprot:3686504-Rhodomonas_salina.1